MPRGKFIVIEGSDGSGKGTQFKLVTDYFKDQGRKVATYDFPQYSKESSYFVREYLNGNYGDVNSLGAYAPSLFYALDRFEVAGAIRNDLEEGGIVLCNRFVGSNMGHQGQKLKTLAERKKYFSWLYDIEFNILGLPKPDVSIVLLVPAEIAQKLVDQKSKRDYTDKKRDAHEADLDHLKRAVSTYQEICSLFPNEFVALDCVENGELLPIPELTQKILALIDQR